MAPPEYTNAIIRLTRYFKGKVNERVELETFRSLRQSCDEGFKQFELKLRIQARRCAFKEREESEILHQIAMGAKDEKVRDKGLEDSMTLDQIMNYAMNREVLIKQKEKARPFKAEGEVNAIGNGQNNFSKPWQQDRSTRQFERPARQWDRPAGQRFQPARQYGRPARQWTRPQNSNERECTGCGSFKHASGARVCAAQGQRCDNCGRVGHFRRKCRSFVNSQKGPRQSSWKIEKREVNQMEAEEEDGDDWEMETRRPTDGDILKVN